MKISEIMKKTSQTINPSNETQEKVWNQVIEKTNRNSSFLFNIKRGFSYAFLVVILIGVGTLTMDLTKSGSDSTKSSTNIEILNDVYYSDTDSVMSNSVKPQESSNRNEINSNVEIIPIESTDNEANRIKAKTASINISVEELDKNVNSIYSLIEEYDGYTENTSISHSYAKIIIRVPSTNFDEMYSKVRLLGNNIISEQVITEDKQTELDNIQHTIETLQAQIDELTSQLNTETDIYEKKELENQIKRLNEDIVSLSKDKNLVLIETSYSTIEVFLTLATKEQDATKTIWIDLKNVLNFWLGMLVKMFVGSIFVAPIVGIIWVIKKVLKILLKK